MSYLSKLQDVADDDVAGLRKAEESYGDSWKRRGGVGAFMMLARKWDRIENALAPPGSKTGSNNYDIFHHAMADRREEGIRDDIRDLRRYLMLVEAEIRDRDEG